MFPFWDPAWEATVVTIPAAIISWQGLSLLLVNPEREGMLLLL